MPAQRLKGWVGTDANGYQFGPEMVSATEEGKWVPYVYRSPESRDITSKQGDLELKNVYVKRRDGLLFALGWYIDADAFTRQLVTVAVDKYRQVGLTETMAYFASPGSALAGLEAPVDCYNSADTIDGQWFAFIGGPGGKIVGHSDISQIGGDTREIFGDEPFHTHGGGEPFHTHGEGGWVESESLRVFVAGTDGHVFGSGWRRHEQGN